MCRHVAIFQLFAVALIATGCTPSVHDAALRADVEIVESLLNANPSLVNLRAGRGKTPLHQAVTSGHERTDELITLLLARGADPNAQDETGMTPLHVAAGWTTRSRATLLVDGGADVDALDALGNSPLHEAVLQGRVAMTHLLLKLGANPKLSNVSGETPLELAENGGGERIIGMIQAQLTGK